MPRVCSLCNHPDREATDAALIAGEAYRHIASRFDTSTAALQRHKNHLPAHLAKAKEAEEMTQADSLFAQLLSLNRETLTILQEARTGKVRDNELALRAIARAEKQIELQARLLGELQNTATVNIVITPEWQQVRAVVLDALAGYHQARIAVAEALGRLSA